MDPKVEHSVAEMSITVTDNMTAHLEGRLIHRVLSTYWLCYYAEVVARRAIEPYFEPSENAIGGLVEIRHHAMAPVGASVCIIAKVNEMKGKKIVCEIEAKHGDRLIASGTQIQIVLPDMEIKKMVEDAYLLLDETK